MNNEQTHSGSKQGGVSLRMSSKFSNHVCDLITYNSICAETLYVCIFGSIFADWVKNCQFEISCKLEPEHPVRPEFYKVQSFHTHGRLAFSDTMKHTQLETVSDLIEMCVFKYTHKLPVYFTEF